MRKKQKRILIIRPDRIGDVVLSTPIPREIKKTYPDSFVAVLLRSYTKDLYQNNPNVDEIILLDDIPYEGITNFWRKVREIRKFKFTHALSLLPTEKTNYLMFFAGIKTRIGVGHKFYQFITCTKSVSRNKYIPLRHEADYCMDLARKIGIETDNLNTEIFLTQEEQKTADEIRTKLLRGKKYLIGIHSTSGNSAPNWPPKIYRELIEALCNNDDYSIVVTDNIVPDALADIEGIEYPNVNSNLRETIIKISALNCIVSASTGPMHIAAALKIKTVSLFCPMTACSPKLWEPKGNDSRIVIPSDNYCATKCPGDPKKCTFDGEGGINVETVVSEIKKHLS